MDKIGELTTRIFLDLKPVLDWAVRNWAITLIALAIFIYWAGRQKRFNQHHL